MNFLERYHMILRNISWRDKHSSELLLSEISSKFPAAEWRIGHSKVFLKQNTVQFLERLRSDRIMAATLTIQQAIKDSLLSQEAMLTLDKLRKRKREEERRIREEKMRMVPLPKGYSIN